MNYFSSDKKYFCKTSKILFQEYSELYWKNVLRKFRADSEAIIKNFGKCISETLYYFKEITENFKKYNETLVKF